MWLLLLLLFLLLLLPMHWYRDSENPWIIAIVTLFSARMQVFSQRFQENWKAQFWDLNANTPETAAQKIRVQQSTRRNTPEYLWVKSPQVQYKIKVFVAFPCVLQCSFALVEPFDVPSTQLELLHIFWNFKTSLIKSWFLLFVWLPFSYIIYQLKLSLPSLEIVPFKFHFVLVNVFRMTATTAPCLRNASFSIPFFVAFVFKHFENKMQDGARLLLLRHGKWD